MILLEGDLPAPLLIEQVSLKSYLFSKKICLSRITGWDFFSSSNSLRASSLGCSGGRAGKGRRACNYVVGIWIPPPIPRWLPVDWAVRFLPISVKQKQARMKTKIEKHVPRVTSSPPISISHWLFRCRYSNSKDVVASPPSFSRPSTWASRRACLQARALIVLVNGLR